MVLMNVLYSPPESLLVSAMSIVSFVGLSNAGLMEIKGKHLKYSKLCSSSSSSQKLPSKTGMLVLYTPAFFAAVSSILLFPLVHIRFTLLRTAVAIHFFKRILEVLFVHKYSGWMDVDSMVPISLSYFMSSATMIYSQYLSTSLSEPDINLQYIGIPMFFLGIGGNFYHHYLLSKLRAKGEKVYKIPKGGLFSLVICPHYLFEIIGFLGISCISQTWYAFSFNVGTILYLMGRSYATKKWYESKFEDFPKEVKALIPYIF